MNTTCVLEPRKATRAAVIGVEGEIIERKREEALLHFEMPVSMSKKNIQGRLLELLLSWKKETQFLSSTTAIIANQKYQEIIGLGEKAVPFLLEMLRDNDEPELVFHALLAITEVNPVPAEHRGDWSAISRDWVKWGVEEGYIEANAA